MSKRTLANRLRDIANRIEEMSEDAEVGVRIHCHSSHSADLTIQALKIGEGCESELIYYGTSNWVDFKNMHGEPIELRVFYNPEIMQEAAIA